MTPDLGLILDATGLTNGIDPQDAGHWEITSRTRLSAILTVLFFLSFPSNLVPFLENLNIYYLFYYFFKINAIFIVQTEAAHEKRTKTTALVVTVGDVLLNTQI